MDRRTALAYAVSALSLSLAGCVGTDSDGSSENQTPTDTSPPTESATTGPTPTPTATPTPTPTTTPTPESRVLIDEAIYGDTRVPFEADEGDTLHVSVELERGTLVVVQVVALDPNENLHAEKVRTKTEFSVELPRAESFFIDFGGALDRASVETVLKQG